MNKALYVIGGIAILLGLLFLFPALNSARTDMATELIEPTFDMGGELAVTLSWTNGEGAEGVEIRGALDGYPATVNEGEAIYSGGGTSASHTTVSSGQHWYYRIWAYSAAGGKVQYSDDYIQGNVVIP